MKILLKSMLVAPACLGVALAVSASAIAADASAKDLMAKDLGLTAQTDVTVQVESTVTPAEQPQVAQVEVAPAETVKLSEVKLNLPAVAEPQKIAQALPDVSEKTESLSQVNRYGREGRGNAMSQVTSVSQLSDVKPTDWAFQALQSLVERYGCIAGYPDKTYRGNRALTRYEFAAGLNACLDRVNELIAAATADLVKKEDLATLQKLQEEFAAELATLRGRVDSLEARTATLEKQQFSTTTKLSGEVVFAVTDEFSVNPAGGGNNTVFQNRVRLALNTSFTGKDLLITRIAAGNATGFTLPAGGGAEGIQTFNFGNTGGNQAFIDWVAYYFPVGEKLKFYVPAVSGLHYDYAPTASPALDVGDAGTGPLSIFAQRNPIYLIGGGSGVGVNYAFNKAVTLSLGYLADNSDGTQITFAANNPASKAGLFNGSYSALAQIAFTPSDALSVNLTYVNAYRRAAIFDGGSGLASSGTLFANGVGLGVGPAKVNAYGVSAAYKLSPQLVINGFFSYVEADFVGSTTNGNIWTYGLGVALPDFGKKGNLLGITAGVEPYLGNAVNNSIPIHVEGFYKYQLNDRISVTPGLIWIINPGQTDSNNDALIGTLRTTFTF
jgi:Carbohydrate-selective porin, OprB family/S-layer homology domain